VKIFNLFKVNQTIIGRGNTCIANIDQQNQDLLAHGFEILRGPDGPQTPSQRILSGPEVPTLPHDKPLPLRTRYIEILQEGEYWSLAVDGAELLQHAGRAACLRMLELITAPEAEP
jgi:hypothetical protein